MANKKSFFIRLYPFKKERITDDVIEKIVHELKILFYDNACFYFNSINNNYLDICFHYRNWLDDFFNSKLITDHFHIWIRKADEGGWYDYVSFASSRYEIDNQISFDEFGNEWSAINLKDIQYNNSCLYKADKLSVYGKSKNAKCFVQNILSESLLRGTRKKIELDSNLKWSIMDPIRYLSSSFSEFNYFQNVVKVQNKDIYEFMELQGSLSHAMIEDFSLTFNKEMRRIIFSEKNDNEYDSVSSIEMELMGKRVYRFQQNSIEGIKEQNTWNSWDNCIDEEFTKFITWYNRD